MNEEKNIMKYVILYFDDAMEASIHTYTSLETLNKIKKRRVQVSIYSIYKRQRYFFRKTR